MTAPFISRQYTKTVVKGYVNFSVHAYAGSKACPASFSDNGATVTFNNPTGGPVGTNQRWQPTAATQTTSAISSGGSTPTANYYKQLQNTYTATPNSPVTWDAILSVSVTGTIGGSAGQTGCTITTASGGGSASCTSWFDYNTAVSLPSPLTVNSGERWNAPGVTSFTDTTGGHSDTVSYNKQFFVTFSVTIGGNGNCSQCAVSAYSVVSGSCSGTIAAGVWCNQGSVIQVTATGTSQHHFDYWSATGSIAITSADTNNPGTATINGAGTITANFF